MAKKINNNLTKNKYVEAFEGLLGENIENLRLFP